MEFRLLGPIEADHDHRRVDLGRRQERCLLGLLLLEPGRPVAVERLASLLWGKEAADGARKTLHTYVARLRASLAEAGVPLLTPAPGFYSVQVDINAIDLHRFTGLVSQAREESDPVRRAALLRDALSLWRGAFLADVATDQVRERIGAQLEEQRLSAAEMEAEASLACGWHDQVLPSLTRLAEEHPGRERFCELLMLALYRCGRKTEALAAYRRTRDLVVTEHGLEPGSDLQSLHHRILRDDPALAAPPTRSASAGPRFLPRDTPGFTGRRPELAQLDSFAETDSRTAGAVLVTAMTGVAGVGKTALAVHWAHRSSGRYPDGQLYIDLRGYGPGHPLRPIEALQHLLRMQGTAGDQIPFEEHDAIAVYRAAFANRRWLVLIDNASTVEQVRPLLPSSHGSLAVVTSRDRLSGLIARDGARRLALGVLIPDDSVDLLATILSHERVKAEWEGAHALAAACGYLPLALRIAAANLADQPDTRLGDYATKLLSSDRLAELEIVGDPQSAIRAAFGDSYRALSADEQRAFRLMGNFEGQDIPIEAVSRLLDLDASGAEGILERLVNAHLLDEHVSGRFTMHDLLRDFARYLSEDPEDELAGLQRLTEWYLDKTDSAARLLDPRLFRMREVQPKAATFPTQKAASEWLELERVNLIRLVAQASTRRLPEAYVLADALRAYLVFRAPLDLLTVADAAIRAADAHDDQRAQVALHLGRAHALSMIERPHEAAEAAKKAAELSTGLEWPEGERAVLGMLGMTLFEAGDLAAAMDYTSRSLELARLAGDTHAEAIALNRVALVALLRGDLRAAAGYFEQGTAVHEASGQHIEHTIVLLNLGDVCRLMGDLDRAEENLNRSISRARELNHPVIEAVARYGLATVLRLRGGRASALEEAREAHAVLSEAGVPQPLVHAKQALAAIYAEVGDWSSAEDLVKEALPMAATLGIKYSAVELWLTYADILRRAGRLEEAADYTQRALDTAKASGYLLLVGEALTVAAEIELDRGNWDAAVPLSEQAAEIQRGTGHRPGEIHAAKVADVARARP